MKVNCSTFVKSIQEDHLIFQVSLRITYNFVCILCDEPLFQQLFYFIISHLFSALYYRCDKIIYDPRFAQYNNSMALLSPRMCDCANHQLFDNKSKANTCRERHTHSLMPKQPITGLAGNFKSIFYYATP